MFGYFDDPHSESPDYDPGLDVDCPVCERSIRKGDVKTVSFMAPGDGRSYFYRIHKDCATPEREQEIESLIIDNHINIH